MKIKKKLRKKQDAPKNQYHSVLIYVGNEQKQQICLISHLRFQHQIKSLEEVTIVLYVDKLVKIYEIVSEKKLFLFWQLSWIQIFTKITTLVEVYPLYHLCIGSYWFKYVNCFLRRSCLYIHVFPISLYVKLSSVLAAIFDF